MVQIPKHKFLPPKLHEEILNDELLEMLLFSKRKSMLLKVGQNVYRKVLLGLVLVEDSEDPEKEFRRI